MENSVEAIVGDESRRIYEFPVARNSVFLAHAGVAALPRCVADAIVTYTRQSSEHHQEFGTVLGRIEDSRATAAKLIGSSAGEISLLGPTSLGLSLVAEGLTWNAGDEVICYRDDYPANVYPWMGLERHGVKIRFVEVDEPGRITTESVAREITPRTKLVALASCHFLTGWRIDIDAIGALCRERDVLFCLDAIQTLGAFPTTVGNVDFLSADSHKWLLGPLSAGIFFARSEHANRLRPALVGAWNAYSPDFVAQDAVTFPSTGRRYEPGVLNIGPIFGMRAAMEMLLEVGIDNVARRILDLRAHLAERLIALGFELAGPPIGHANSSSITTVSHATRDLAADFAMLEKNGVVASLRRDRQGRSYLRFSPHFYNTHQELDRVVGLLDA
jgi:selenocysteine lyase/cysteine desulfurase